MSAMRTAGLTRVGCGLTALLLGGCAKGVDDDPFTFGQLDTGPATTNSNTSGPFDPTTGGNASMTSTGSGSDRPETTTDSPSDTTGPDSTATTAGSDSTGPSGPVCGDGVAEPGEECDGDDLAGLTCPDVDPMTAGGTLLCTAGCTFDSSGCTNADNPIQVCQPVGGAILDNSLLSDTIVLPAGQLGGTITDVNVEVELDHSWIGDLDIDLTSGGTNVALFSSCGSEDNLHVTFDDSGGGLNCASSDINAVVQPLGSLSSFNGGVVSSNWTLDINDTAAGDTGTLQQWCLTISWM